jgi:hypothetical protein
VVGGDFCAGIDVGTGAPVLEGAGAFWLALYAAMRALYAAIVSPERSSYVVSIAGDGEFVGGDEALFVAGVCRVAATCVLLAEGLVAAALAATSLGIGPNPAVIVFPQVWDQLFPDTVVEHGTTAVVGGAAPLAVPAGSLGR